MPLNLNRALTWLTPLLGVAIFAIVVNRAGPSRIAAVLANVELKELVWAPLLVGAIALARGLRWRYVAASMGIPYGLHRATRAWMIGFFASSITPAKAGDALRAVYLSRESGRPVGESLFTVFVDRLWDFGFILCAGVASTIAFSRLYAKVPSAPLFVASAVVLGLAAAALTRRGFMRALLRPAFSVLVPTRYRAGFAANFHSFYDALRVYGGGDLRRTVTMALLTLLCWSLIFTLAIYVARLLDIAVQPEFVVLMMPIVTLVELIPFSVSGLGTRDATVVYFFSVVGLGSAEAVGFSIVYVLIGTYATALLGLALWLKHPIQWSDSRGA
jgi:uncharacterized protein (TIRG00374 family)